jgi:hypothetical protein
MARILFAALKREFKHFWSPDERLRTTSPENGGSADVGQPGQGLILLEI